MNQVSYTLCEQALRAYGKLSKIAEYGQNTDKMPKFIEFVCSL